MSRPPGAHIPDYVNMNVTHTPHEVLHPNETGETVANTSTDLVDFNDIATVFTNWRSLTDQNELNDHRAMIQGAENSPYGATSQNPAVYQLVENITVRSAVSRAKARNTLMQLNTTYRGLMRNNNLG